MTTKFSQLGMALDKKSYQWLVEEDEEVAIAVAAEVTGGGDPDAIGRYVAQQIGETRPGYVNRIKSAARYIKSEQAR